MTLNLNYYLYATHENEEHRLFVISHRLSAIKMIETETLTLTKNGAKQMLSRILFSKQLFIIVRKNAMKTKTPRFGSAFKILIEMLIND